MKFPFVVLALLCLAVPALSAQLDTTDPPYQSLCRATLAKRFTPPPIDAALKADCDSVASYSGIGRPVDYVAARSCAFTEYAHPEADTSRNIFFGAGVLSMIYANGEGTPADLDLAIRFTCEEFAAPAEIEERLDALTTARGSHTSIHFDLCDSASSGNAVMWCISVRARLSAVERNTRLEKLRASLPAAATASLAELQRTEDDFIRLRLENELDLRSTNLGARRLSEENDLRDQFVADLESVTAVGFRKDVELKMADKKLSAAMRPVQIASLKARLPHAAKTIGETTITFRGVEETQQSWLRVREAWVGFAQTVTSVTNGRDQVAALVTTERAQQLERLFQSPSNAENR